MNSEHHMRVSILYRRRKFWWGRQAVNFFAKFQTAEKSRGWLRFRRFSDRLNRADPSYNFQNDFAQKVPKNFAKTSKNFAKTREKVYSSANADRRTVNRHPSLEALGYMRVSILYRRRKFWWGRQAVNFFAKFQTAEKSRGWLRFRRFSDRLNRADPSYNFQNDFAQKVPKNFAKTSKNFAKTREKVYSSVPRQRRTK